MKPLKTSILAMVMMAMMFPLFAQSDKPEVPRFEKKEVGTRGAAAYLIKGSPDYEMTESEDGSRVYTTEGTSGDYFFASIVVEFEPVMEGSPEEMEELLISYMEFLQGQFGVGETAGVGKGHTKEKFPAVRGVIDYWLDAEGVRYAVKGWVDQSMLNVSLIYGPDDYPIYNVQEMFLNGFRFPGE